MKRKTRSGKAGLRFPVARIHNLLKRSTGSMRISVHAPVYLGAVLEYLTAEILETAGVVARQYQHPRITPRHIQIGAKGDEEMGQLLSDVILSEGGVIPEPYRAQLYPIPENKDTKKKKIHRKKSSQDTSRIHIGGPSSLRGNKKGHLKRKRSLSCGDEVDRCSLFKRPHVREKNGTQGNRSSFQEDRYGIGLAFLEKSQATDKTNFEEPKSSGSKNNLSFQGFEELFGRYNFNSFDLSKGDETLETSWELPDRNRGNFNMSLVSTTSTLQTYANESFNRSFQSFRESFQNYDESFRGSNQSFQGPFEGSFSSQHDGRSPWQGNISVSSTNLGFTSPFNSLSHQKQQSAAPWDYQNLDFQSRSSFESLNPQNFNDSVMNFEDFILERSNIPTDLLEMSIQRASPKNHQLEDVVLQKNDLEDVVLRKNDNLNNNLSKDEISERRNIPEIRNNEEISTRNNNLEIQKKIALKDWKTSKKNGGSFTNDILENEMKKTVLHNDSQTNVSLSSEKIEIESNISPKSENIVSQLITDFQIYSESDSSEALHVDVSIDKDNNASVPIKSNNEVNIENGFEWNGTRNEDESGLLQDCVVSSSLGLHGSNSSSSNSSSIAPCPGSKQKHHLGDLVWARLADSSFYPAIVINDPHYKFYTKIVETSPSLDSNENGNNRLYHVQDSSGSDNNRLYHVQFLYKSSRTAWIPSSRIIRYEGITRYEERVKKDVENMSMYRPRNSNLKLQWREAVLTAKRLEILGKLERIGKCEDARFKYLDFKGKEQKDNRAVGKKYSLKVIGSMENHSKDKDSKGKDELIEKKLLMQKKDSSRQKKDLIQKELGEPIGAKIYQSYREPNRGKLGQSSRETNGAKVGQSSREPKGGKLGQSSRETNGANLLKSSSKNYKKNSPQVKNGFKSKLGSSKNIKTASNKNMHQKIVQITNDPIHKIVDLKEMDGLVKMREEFETGKISSTNNVETNRNSSSSQKTNGSDKRKEIDKNSLKEGKPLSEVTKNIKETDMKTKMTKVVTTITDDKFARPGDLVWARMRGFPHWPGFVTNSPRGIYKKEGKSAGNTNYHVQFFNWNDESAWVNSIVKFNGVDHFKKTKTFRTMKLRSLEQKWYQAAGDAEETIGLSRTERLNEYLVPYDEV